MPSSAWASASATRISIHACRRASWSKMARTSSVPQRCAYSALVGQAGAHAGAAASASVRNAVRTWSSEAPQGTTTR